MMCSLLFIMIILAVRSVTLEGALEGVKFYLLPDFKKMAEAGIGDAIYAAMGQAFFTLSLGIGALAIFGSYIGKERRLTGEAVNVCVLDTIVALMSGLIIFPACFAFGVQPGEGPSLVFITLPNIFNHMPVSRLWGSLFFIFMAFASLTTIIAVFEKYYLLCKRFVGLGTKKRQSQSISSRFFFFPCPAYWALICSADFSLWAKALQFWI